MEVTEKVNKMSYIQAEKGHLAAIQWLHLNEPAGLSHACRLRSLPLFDGCYCFYCQRIYLVKICFLDVPRSLAFIPTPSMIVLVLDPHPK